MSNCRKEDPYADWFRKQYPGITTGMRRLGLNPNNVEDGAMSYVERFLGRDSLEKFDPTQVNIGRDGKPRLSTLDGYTSVGVRAYGPYYVQKQVTGYQREPVICDHVVDPVSGTTWLDDKGDSVPSHEDEVINRLAALDLLTAIRNHLRTVPRRCGRDMCDLPAFFEAYLEQVETEGKHNERKLSQRFGVSGSAIRNWVKHMRAEVTKVISISWHGEQ